MRALVMVLGLAIVGCQQNDAKISASNNAPAFEPPATALSDYQPSSVGGMVRIEEKGFFYSPSKWDRPAIPVCWEPSAAAGLEREWVKDAVTKSWQTHSALRFFGWVNCAQNASGIRIGVRDDGPDNGPQTLDLGKALNAKPNGMTLNFTFRTWSPSCSTSAQQRESCIRSIAVHEFGHAIGFAHEQNRSDTPGECTKKPQGRDGDRVLTPWDPKSVMNYCNPVYNNDGMLSAGDITSVRAIYGE